MEYCFVVTTINVPTLLEDYAKILAKKEKIGFIVVGDKKTPHEKLKLFMENLKGYGCESEYLDLKNQEKYIKKYHGLAGILSYNSTQRRNIGYLKAAEYGSRILIILDDDNYISDGKYLNHIKHIGKKSSFMEVKSSIGWFNPCSMLKTDHGNEIYMRGFPYAKRYIKNQYSFKKKTGRAVLNMGLWTHNPDVDAVTNLAQPTEITGLKKGPHTLMLGKGTFMPINTQNTAIATEILPCFYDVMQGYSFKGLKIDRYSDVWAGFLAKKAIDHMGDKITVGQPLSKHIRNSHNLLNDLKMELWGMLLTEKFVDWLESVNIKGNTYIESYDYLSKDMKKNLAPSFDDSIIRKYFEKLSNAMNVWTKACSQIIK